MIGSTALFDKLDDELKSESSALDPICYDKDDRLYRSDLTLVQRRLLR